MQLIELRADHRRGSEGFTLIELLIAMVVLVVGLLALWSLHAASIEASARAYRLGICTTLAQDAMEKLMSETLIANDPSGINPDLAPMGIIPPAATDGLEDLGGAVDGLLQNVNGLGTTDPTMGPLSYYRTYHTQYVGAETDRILIHVRVTYIDDAARRHGVTLASTRLVDRYDPLNLGVSSIGGGT